MTRTLVVLSLESWDAVWRRNQYLIDGLLRTDPGLEVLFVEPARDLLHDLMTSRRARRAAGLRVAEGYGGRLQLFQPAKWMPRLLGSWADRSLRRQLRGAMRATGARRGILWINDPAWARLTEWAGWSALYDITDDWLAARRSGREHARIARNETQLMRRCAAVVACSPGIVAVKRSVRPDIVLVQNAVDTARYRRSVARPADLGEHRAAVYVGTLHEDRLDIELVVLTGQRLAEEGAELVLVGPNALSVEHTRLLDRTPGVRILGARPYEQIPAYLQHAAVLIVPHVVDEFTDSLDPLKLYEYQAVCRPIVSTPVAGFRALPQLAGVAVVERGGFAAAVAAVVRTEAPAVEWPTVPDWSTRVEQYRQLLRAHAPA